MFNNSYIIRAQFEKHKLSCNHWCTLMSHCTSSFKTIPVTLSLSLSAGVNSWVKEGNRCSCLFHLPKLIKLQKLMIHFDLNCDKLQND